jgi:mono/diheme cytochrome c family protein
LKGLVAGLYRGFVCIPAIAVLLSADPVLADTRVARGQSLVTEHCAQCHAIGAADRSPLIAAPVFRGINERLNSSELFERLQEGLSSAHKDMPSFRFSRTDAHAIRSYLNSIQR